MSDPTKPPPQTDATRVPTLSYARPNMAARRPRLPWLALAAGTLAWVPVLVTILRPSSTLLRASGIVFGGCALGLAVGVVLRPARPRVLFDLLEILAVLIAIAGFIAAILLNRA